MNGMPLTATTHALPAAAPVRTASAPRRPGESYERPGVSPGTLRALAVASAEESVPLDVAATLICEAGLLLESLDRHRLSGARARLDRAAGTSRVTKALTASNADYLRALSCRSWRRQSGELAIPARVTGRVGEGLEERLARCDLLGSAIRWEVAAVLAERSMANWGSQVVLAGFR